MPEQAPATMADAHNGIVVVILTFNCEKVIGDTVRAALKVSPNVLCVDSGSTDATVAICGGLGATLLTRAFKNYSDQRNWAIEQVEGHYAWQLHLDADEVLDDQAVTGIRHAHQTATDKAYLIRRKTYFMGKPLHYGGTVTWHLRFFRSGAGRCENRLYDQHFVSPHKAGLIDRGWMHDKNAGSIAEWTARHNRWADLESEEATKTDHGPQQGVLEADLLGDSRQRTRYLKSGYYGSPMLWRASAYFVYRYVFRLGFLDGRIGFIYCALQAFWFRVLVDAKIMERQTQASGGVS
jgi:glycosyltransferase involved in cell wall biosynthesis